MSVEAGTLPSEPFDLRVEALERQLGTLGVGAFVTADSDTVRWLTGISSPTGAGWWPWSVGPIALVCPGGGTVICPSESVEEAGGPLRLRSYSGLTLEPGPVRPDLAAGQALSAALEDAGVGDLDSIAVEDANAAARAALGRRPLVDATEIVAAARMHKDGAARVRLQEAARVVSVGQRRFREQFESHRSELDLWAAVHDAILGAAQEMVPTLPELTSGERIELIGAPPSSREIRPGDAAMLDLMVRVDGWWSDSCVTLAAPPSPRLRAAHDVARRALDRATAAVRPGVTAGEVDAIARETLGDAGLACPHHMGHGLGTGPHEEPRLVPGSATRLEEGMVIAIEPGSYAPGAAGRVEHVVCVEADGARVITDYRLELDG